jgi:hypothetical protein
VTETVGNHEKRMLVSLKFDRQEFSLPDVGRRNVDDRTQTAVNGTIHACFARVRTRTRFTNTWGSTGWVCSEISSCAWNDKGTETTSIKVGGRVRTKVDDVFINGAVLLSSTLKRERKERKKNFRLKKRFLKNSKKKKIFN